MPTCPCPRWASGRRGRLGEWFRQQPPEETPTVVRASPYVRARQTAQIALEAAGLFRDEETLTVDERLREREFGILDRLTHAGIVEKYPEQAELRRLLGKFYHRPPGGESWCDVILRLRSVVDMLTREYRGERVLLVCHSVVILCFRYLLERMTEEEILEIDRDNEVANCSVTSYAFDPRSRPARQTGPARVQLCPPRWKKQARKSRRNPMRRSPRK